MDGHHDTGSKICKVGNRNKSRGTLMFIASVSSFTINACDLFSFFFYFTNIQLVFELSFCRV
ncbi:hypothetical protein HanRHA438_Chr08g0341231 [Helianthus annuus]|nr:hypothetical protein HanHA89_Chr08g0289701 [Helianthus annuus]KAJ0897037.1 hypothetical protein HanRHA438_Chr08g0341231 [Helianthus annuus]